MDSEQFLNELGLPVNADMDAVEPAFIDHLRERLRVVAEEYNERELKEEDKWLRSFLSGFFNYTSIWINKEAQKYKGHRELDNAPEMKQKAKAVVSELQDYIKEFVSCYMHLGRFMTLLRDEIKAEEIKLAKLASRKIKWTSDSGYVLARYRKERKQLLMRMQRLLQAKPLLTQIEDDFEKLRSAVLATFGKKADAPMRGFNSAVRTTDFEKAHRMLKSIIETKKKFGIDQKAARQNLETILECGQRIIDNVEKEKDQIHSEENKVFLKPFEADTAYNNDVRELHKIKEFLLKYHMPYMEYKLETLQHLKDKLLVLNTLESLMLLYKKLLLGIAQPFTDIKTIRLYESEVLNHTKYLLTGHFTELPKILQRAEETVEEFRQNHTELEEFKGMDLQEIQMSENKSAQG